MAVAALVYFNSASPSLQLFWCRLVRVSFVGRHVVLALSRQAGTRGGSWTVFILTQRLVAPSEKMALEPSKQAGQKYCIVSWLPPLRATALLPQQRLSVHALEVHRL
jgi:hypothetical protein